MEPFEIGSRHSHFEGIEDDFSNMTVIFNDGETAICGFTYEITRKDSHDYRWEHDPFAMTKDEIGAFVPDFAYEGEFCSFVIVNLKNGCLVERREWFRKNDALFIIGQQYHSHEEWDEYIGNTITVYRFDGIAIIKIFDGEGCVYEAFKSYGYNEEEVRAVFPDFKDNYPVNCNEFFYACIRECDDIWVDLHGNSIDDHIYHLI